MILLRNKGNSLPITINISIKNEICNNKSEYKVIYSLEKEERKFEDIQKFLLNVKNNLIRRLNLIYKERTNMRFIYGKQIDSILKYLNGDFKLDSFLRYILNETDNTKIIKEGEIYNSIKTDDYVKQYNLYNKNSFENICEYITSLFRENNTSLEEHYEKMSIINEYKKKYKGIYLYESLSKSMEEDILLIFLEYTRNLPIAQNILIINKETSYEEMQAFFNRAILCKFNTLFVIELNNSFSDYQQKIMNSFIDKLLTFKNEQYQKKVDEIIEKTRTNQYMDSCIIFIYNKKCNESFLSEISRFEPQNFPKIKKSSCNDFEAINLLKKNTHIISSEICGLGKSKKIKKEIKEINKKEYIYFPLGGNLTKNIIFEKLNKIIKKIENLNNNNVAIHLDLHENSEDSTSILNEFLFSFLITKFYSNNENIIYIPKNIEIYIEIPNCFYDFKSNYDILNVFNDENIKINGKPKLDLSKKKIKLFYNMLELNSSKEIENFIYENIEKIGKKQFSYHQIKIFIKLFISQYNKYNGKKLKFLENDKNVTKICIGLFSKGTKYFISSGFSKALIEDAKLSFPNNENNVENYIQVMSDIFDKSIEEEKYESPLIFIIKEEMKYNKLDISDNGLTQYKDSKAFLEKLKEILNLNIDINSLLEIINRDQYVITQDNFRKMILILYRIIARIPVILMGETGCGKTALIRKLNELVNNGKRTLKIINVNPGVTDDFLISKMKKINKEAENSKDEVWVFFDELNTCNSLSLLTEIFIHHSFDGTKLKKNIRIMGACNPYRKKKKNEIICGLIYPNDNNELIYDVNILPQSLMYYVFNFSSIGNEDEKKYISSIISELFNEEENILKDRTTEVISQCHLHLREKFGSSVVSLREMTRFKECCTFFIESYYPKKNKVTHNTQNKHVEKLKSIIISIYICYCIRLVDDNSRKNFDNKLQKYFIDLVNYNSNEKIDNKEKRNLMDKIEEPLKSDLKKEMGSTAFQNFNEIIKLEEKFILSQVNLNKGIGSNKQLKENIFLMFVSLVTNIPLIIIGKPGSGKSLSAQLIYKEMKGKYSDSEFFKEFPSIMQSYFQGSHSTSTEEVEGIFQIAENRLDSLINKNEEDLPISMILFDELGLADKSKNNPLKVLHSRLEYREKKKISFVGISNWTLDAAKINRALVLTVPDLDESIDDLNKTAESIAKSIDEKSLKNNDILIILLPYAYFKYKDFLKKLKLLSVYKIYKINEFNKKIKNKLTEEEFESLFQKSQKDNIEFDDFKSKEKELNNIIQQKDLKVSWKKHAFQDIFEEEDYKKLYKQDKKLNIDFHGNRDFYYLIKGIANDFNGLSNNDKDELENKNEIVKKYIYRNFGGLEIEIDVDTAIEFEEFNETIRYINDFTNNAPNQKMKIKSESLFIKIYNIVCKENSWIVYNIDEDKEVDNKFLSNIINNINDYNSRYLLLQIKPSLGPLIFETIKSKFQNKKITFYEGSPFINDTGNEYQYKTISLIQEYSGKEGLLVLQNLNQVYPFLYDLFNMNFIIKDDKKYARICHGNFSDQLVYIHDKFRIIIMVDKKFINTVDPPFINRFEKVIISSDKLLDERQKIFVNKIYEEKLDFKKFINNSYKINYKINELLIGCKKQDIQGLIYNYSNSISQEEREDEKEYILNKVTKLLPQDVMINIQVDKDIKTKYEQVKYYRLDDYLKKEGKNYLISIIYTFSPIFTNIDNIDESINSKMISQIKSEEQFKSEIDGIIDRNKNEKLNKETIIFLNFVLSDLKKLSFVISFIKNNYNEENITFLITIHLKRNFDLLKNERIYNVLDIYPQVNQIFIDNLNGKKDIELNVLLKKLVKDIIKTDGILELDKEFFKALNKFINNNIDNISNLKIGFDNYVQKLTKYFNDEDENNKFLKRINEKAISFIKEEGKYLIENIYKDSFINPNSIDIISILIDYIKEKILSKYLLYIINDLEDNNIITSLLILNENKNILPDEIVDEIKKEILNNMEYKEKEHVPKFDFDFYIPGFYYFYRDISNYITSNIVGEYSRNEKNLRKLLSKKVIDTIKLYHEKESLLLSSLFRYIQNDDFKFNCLNKVILEYSDLLLNDYITFYLKKIDKNKFNKLTHDDVYHKLINLLLKLRFDKDYEIIKENKDKPIELFLIKIEWIESNIDFITRIIHLYSNFEKLFPNNTQLFSLMEEIITNKNLRYITNEKKNPSHTKEVNECYYKILGAFCLSILPQNIDFQSHEEIEYFNILKIEIKIIENLNDDLMIFLNEMYIIDELIKIYDVLFLKNKLNENTIYEISKILESNNDIIQSTDKEEDKSEKLIKDFSKLHELIRKGLKDEEKEYYNLIYYIFYKEIKKIPDINYRQVLFYKLVEESEMITNINDILKLLLKSVVNSKIDKFINNLKNMLNGKNEILIVIENLLDEKEQNYQIVEALNYFFEKNSYIYLNDYLNLKKNNSLVDEPLIIFKESAEFLYNLYKHLESFKSLNKNITKLFCISYIKSFCTIFIPLINNKGIKRDDIDKIIGEINSLKGLKKIISLYIFKIIYNQNKRKIDIFIDPKYISKYKFDNYDYFKNFVINSKKNPFIYKYINSGTKNINDNYELLYEKLEKYQAGEFDNVNVEDFDIKNLGIDIFYFASCNLILSCLKLKDFIDSIYYSNFYKNICIPLLKINNKIFPAIQFFYNPEKFERIKNEYNINAENLDILLYSYRYCINELYINSPNSIFCFLYNNKNFKNIKNLYFPGNDIRNNIKYYELYSNIKNHLINNKDNLGCFVCSCKNGYCHLIVNGKKKNYLNMKCKECNMPIGTEYYSGTKYIVLVKRNDYFRVFKNKEEIENAKDKNSYNFMTIDEFKEKYIDDYFKEEKGIIKDDINYLKKDNKIVRNLEQISYRLLNFILYSHLFFARLYTENEDFDDFKPEGITWIGIINECWELLKIELSKKGINSIDIFMNYIFFDLFGILNNKRTIKEYNEYIDFEGRLNKLIMNKIEDFKKEYKNTFKKYDKKDTFVYENLLAEQYQKIESKEYLYYSHFYYSDNINEEYLMEKLKHKEENKYPVLSKYLNYYNSKKSEEKYSLDNLVVFNNTLNLLSDYYSHKISRKKAKDIPLNQTDIFSDNKDLFNSFITFYNKLGLNINGQMLKLSENSKLFEFFIDDDNNIGKSYKDIYFQFIRNQNNQISNLIDIKIIKGIFNEDSRNKVNIQNIKESEIFSFNLKKHFFIDSVFNSSYRKIILKKNDIKLYNEYEINFDLIEERMTNKLLKGKKLLNNSINDFIYQNEDLLFKNANYLDILRKYFSEKLSLNDKVILYTFYEENKENNNLFKELVIDFITLILYFKNNYVEKKK